MPFENTKILEFNQYQTSDRASFIFHGDSECFIEKTCRCKNSPEHSSTIKVCEHIPSGFPTLTISSFKNIENRHDVYRVHEQYTDFMKKFCEFLREHTQCNGEN